MRAWATLSTPTNATASTPIAWPTTEASTVDSAVQILGTLGISSALARRPARRVDTMNKKLCHWVTALAIAGMLGAMSPTAEARKSQPRCGKHKTLSYGFNGVNGWTCR